MNYTVKSQFEKKYGEDIPLIGYYLEMNGREIHLTPSRLLNLPVMDGMFKDSAEWSLSSFEDDGNTLKLKLRDSPQKSFFKTIGIDLKYADGANFIWSGRAYENEFPLANRLGGTEILSFHACQIPDPLYGRLYWWGGLVRNGIPIPVEAKHKEHRVDNVEPNGKTTEETFPRSQVFRCGVLMDTFLWRGESVPWSWNGKDAYIAEMSFSHSGEVYNTVVYSDAAISLRLSESFDSGYYEEYESCDLSD